MLLNLCTIILPFLLSCTNRRCANLPRMSVRAYGSIKRKKERKKSCAVSVGVSQVCLGGFMLHRLVYRHTPGIAIHSDYDCKQASAVLSWMDVLNG